MSRAHTTQLPLPLCNNCGKCTGHLYDQYNTGIITLVDLHDKFIESGVGSTDLSPVLGDAWTNYLLPYYTYLNNLRSSDPKKHAEISDLYKIKALMARALLFHRPLTDADMPLNEHEKDDDSIRLCCIKTFMCDHSNSIV